jgi:hypothetical protein
MKRKNNYAEINDEGKLEIHTDNAFVTDEQTKTEINSYDMFEINGDSLLKIYAMLQDKSVTMIKCKESVVSCKVFVVVGENSEAKQLATMCKTLLDAIENFNNTRHWWERKIKIDREL